MKWWFLCFLYVKTKDMSSIASGPCGSFLLILLFNLFQHFRMDSKWVGRKEEKTDIIKKGLIYDKLCLQGLEFGLLIYMSYIFNDLNFIAFKCQIFLAKKKVEGKLRYIQVCLSVPGRIPHVIYTFILFGLSYFFT
jgi:hypothetical protein